MREGTFLKHRVHGTDCTVQQPPPWLLPFHLGLFHKFPCPLLFPSHWRQSTEGFLKAQTFTEHHNAPFYPPLECVELPYFFRPRSHRAPQHPPEAISSPRLSWPPHHSSPHATPPPHPTCTSAPSTANFPSMVCNKLSTVGTARGRRKPPFPKLSAYFFFVSCCCRDLRFHSSILMVHLVGLEYLGECSQHSLVRVVYIL